MKHNPFFATFLLTVIGLSGCQNPATSSGSRSETRIILTASSSSIEILGGQLQLAVSDSNGAMIPADTVQWEVMDGTGHAEVSNSGEVTGLLNGTLKIIARKIGYLDSIPINIDINGKDIYSVGTRYDATTDSFVPCYFKNRECYNLPILSSASPRGWASAIVADAGHIYIAGTCEADNGDYAPCYWVDGVLHTLSAPAGPVDTYYENYGFATGISVFNGDVYVSGQYTGRCLCYWKNGTINQLALPSNTKLVSGNMYGLTYSIQTNEKGVFVSGGVFLNNNKWQWPSPCVWANGVAILYRSATSKDGVSTISYDGSTLLMASRKVVGSSDDPVKAAAKLYSHDVWSELDSPQTTNQSALFGLIPTGIIPQGNSVLVTGGFNWGLNYACVWTDNLINILPFQSNRWGATAFSSVVDGGSLFTAGEQFNSDGTHNATIWVNGRPIEIGDKYSEVTAIEVAEP